MADGNESDSADTKEEGAAASTITSTNATVNTEVPVNSFGASPASRDENPFSFRHFLRRAQNPPVHLDPPRSDEEYEARRFGGARPKTGSRRTHHIPENEIKSPCGLPDFVQDHLVVDHDVTRMSNGSSRIPEQIPGQPQQQVPVESPLDLPRSQSPIHAAGAMPIPLDLANLASSNVDLANLNASLSGPREEPAEAGIPHEINNNENINNLSQLPDFLSDGPMNQQRHQEPSEQEQSPIHSEEENVRMRQQLDNTLASERVALARIERLESLLEEHRRRELAEASSLEKALEQVESNLRIMQQRAIQAETQATQLRKENRRLQDEINSLRQGDSAGASCGQRGLSRTAQELKSAASSAERSIRELLTGVDHLRVIATALENMERAEEFRPKRDGSEDNAD